MTPIDVVMIRAALGPMPAWRMRASCATVYVPHPDGADDPWYPTADSNAKKDLVAKQICSRCPVRAECLADALATQDRFGIRGGLTPGERRRFQAQAS